MAEGRSWSNDELGRLIQEMQELIGLANDAIEAKDRAALRAMIPSLRTVFEEAKAALEAEDEIL